MTKTRRVIYVILYFIVLILSVCSILSIFRNAEVRYLKMLDFPRIQFFLGALISLPLFILVVKKWKLLDYLLVLSILIGMIINGRFLIHYTTLVNVEVPDASDIQNPDNILSLLITNVKITNRNAQPIIEQIKLKKPDLVLAMEVNQWWENQLKVIEYDYPFSQHTINDVSYGMILYSKLPLKNVEVDYLNNQNVPSFESTLNLKNGENIRLYSVHPVPPTHFKKYPDNAGQDEKAFEKIGKLIENRKLPTIVAGDFNDVVWSYVDDLTGTEDIFYDVRVGRGFYNSFSAENFLFKWPLDHVLVTEEFQLNKLERLPDVGSDHFPIYVELVLKNN